MAVEARGFGVAVPQEGRHGVERCPGHHQVGGEGMPQRVRRDLFLPGGRKSRQFHESLEALFHAFIGDLDHSFGLGIGFSPPLQVGEQFIIERHYTRAAGLCGPIVPRGDREEALVEVHVLPTERQGLAGSQARKQSEHDEGFDRGGELRRSFPELDDFLRRQEAQPAFLFPEFFLLWGWRSPESCPNPRLCAAWPTGHDGFRYSRSGA